MDLPDTSALLEPDLEPDPDSLPAGWNTLPTSATAQSFGSTWLRRGDTLAMKIPSVIVPEEANFVINPLHPDYPQVQFTAVRPFSFDQRLTK